MEIRGTYVQQAAKKFPHPQRGVQATASVPAAWITVSVERNNHDEKEDGQ